jgi:hypothetical protein
MSEGQDGRDGKEYAGPICGGDEGRSSGNGLPIDVRSYYALVKAGRNLRRASW